MTIYLFYSTQIHAKSCLVKIIVCFQCQNFLRLCELLVRSCSNLKLIELMTSTDNKSQREQYQWFGSLQEDLAKYGVNLVVKYSETLHDRQIT